MKREIWDDLLNWKSRKDHKPLIIRGVRQCGKTWIIKEFSKKSYPDFAYFNFEGNPNLHFVFEADLDPVRIIRELEIIRNKKIIQGKTLLIFDEIQFCNKALTSLKYFNENMPEVDIIAAGSLLGLALSKPLSFPVGKVEFLDLFPMSFSEYIIACGEELLAQRLDEIVAGAKVPDSMHFKLTQMLHDYYFVGGMPEVVKAWSDNKDTAEVTRIQKDILDSYELDFAKHAPDREFEKLSLIWNAVPVQLAHENQKFIFSRVKEGYRGRDLESALQWLVSAGLIYKVSRIEKPGIPLRSYANDSHYKIYMCDVGLMRAMANIPMISIKQKDHLYKEFRGAITENFCLTELVSKNITPVFWKSKQTAEVDFVCQIGRYLIPVEVKSEENVRSRSLSVYMEKFKPEISVRLSMKNAGYKPPLYSVPLYLANKLPEWFG